jgi:2-keto-4-pentenoate hydratase
MVQQLLTAAEDKQAIPLLSRQWSVTVDEAYIIQTLALRRGVNRLQPEGFKACLTSAAGQKKFAVQAPVAGVLVAGSGRHKIDGRYRVNSADYGKMMLEAELGFRVKERISVPIADIASLKTKIQTVLPIIELPDLNFA